MAVLKEAQKKRMAPSTFGLPAKKGPQGGVKGKYPMPDKSHASNAKARATQMVAKGKLSPADAAKIRHKANHILGETDSTYHNRP